MTRSRRRKKKKQPPPFVSPAWGSLDEALATIDTLDADSLEQVCHEVSRIARGLVESVPKDDDDYPLPPVVIALAGYFESLALNVRSVWLREIAGDGVDTVAEAAEVGVLKDLRGAMRLCAAWRAVGVLMGQKQPEGDENTAGDPSEASGVLGIAKSLRDAEVV